MLAVVAAVMSVHPDMKPWQRSLWMLLIGAFMIVEFRAIDKDRKENQESQAKIREDDRKSFQSILDQGTRNFGDLLRSQQNSFRETTRLLLTNERDERSQFSSVLTAQKAVFDHQEQVMESLGGQLIPAGDPTPPNPCRNVRPRVTFIKVGNRNNFSYTSQFPHTVIRSKRYGDVLSINRSKDNSLRIRLDMRSADGKIIARLNDDGFILNRNNYLEARRDASSLIVIDQYGAEVLNLRYLNPNAISVSGGGMDFPSFINGSCSGDSGGVDIDIP